MADVDVHIMGERFAIGLYDIRLMRRNEKVNYSEGQISCMKIENASSQREIFLAHKLLNNCMSHYSDRPTRVTTPSSLESALKNISMIQTSLLHHTDKILTTTTTTTTTITITTTNSNNGSRNSNNKLIPPSFVYQYYGWVGPGMGFLSEKRPLACSNA